MAYLFWILVGIVIAYILPVAWHIKCRNWMLCRIGKPPKPVKPIPIPMKDNTCEQPMKKNCGVANDGSAKEL